MDSYSASDVSRLLGTNVPRVLRAFDRLGLPVRRRRGVRAQLTRAQVARLRDYLGAVAPAPGLSRVETQVLAALARAPRGLLSARSVARRAGVSPTAATRTLASLEDGGLVVRERQMAALGRAREVEVWRASFGTPAWLRLAPYLALVRAPVPAPPRHARRVPAELGHLFWNTARSQLELDRAGGYVARRLIQAGDLDGLAWGAEHLRAEDWRHAAAARGLDPRMKALALNLAEGSS